MCLKFLNEPGPVKKIASCDKKEKFIPNCLGCLLKIRKKQQGVVVVLSQSFKGAGTWEEGGL